MTPEQSRPIVPTQREIDAWRASAEQAICFGGFKLGEFNWPQAVLSLANEWERSKRRE